MDYDEDYNEIGYDHMDYEDIIRKIWVVASCTMAFTARYYYNYIYKEPCMTSTLTGEIWIKELINGNPIHCVNAFNGAKFICKFV